jgi:signal transduction histidine kinase
MLAVARERAVQLRLLHDNAVQTLEAISGGRYTDLASIRLRARAEAERLEAALDRVAAAAALVEWLAFVAAEHRARGLVVELDVDRAAAVVPSVAEAIAAACSEALTNVAKHAETREVTVRVRAEGTGVILVVDDRGVGFVAESTGEGFGMTQSIYGRMADVGGSASVTSRPGVGTRVELRWPA